MNYRLWWLPNQVFDGTEKSVGIFNSHADAIKDIINFFGRKGVNIPYFREWKEQDTDIIFIDYSSHLHYYAIERIDNDGSK